MGVELDNELTIAFAYSCDEFVSIILISFQSGSAYPSAESILHTITYLVAIAQTSTSVRDM